MRTGVVVSLFLLAACGDLPLPGQLAGDPSPPPKIESHTEVVYTAPAPARPATTEPQPTPVVEPAPAPAVTCSGKSGAPGDLAWDLWQGIARRTYRVHLPPSYDPSRGMPVVFNIHGLNSPDGYQEAITGIYAKSDAEGFIAVHPDGVARSWNAGTCCFTAQALNVDDVGFVRTILDRLESELCIDRRRVYAMGFSNGGMFTHRLACELSDRIAAVAVGSGVVVARECAPARAVPVLHVHGTADSTVPFDGRFPWFPTPESGVLGWVDRNGCSFAVTTTYERGAARCETYSGCRDDARVSFCTVDGGTHEWFTPESDLDETRLAWDFLRGFSLP